jgi:hypothetical protein
MLNALLSEVRIGIWQATKTDRSASDTLNYTSHAVGNASRVQKKLLVGAAALKAVNDVALAARKYHAMSTLPWSDDGPRLVPMKIWLDYNKKMHDYKAEFNDRVADFLDIYPTLVTEAKNNLGDLFDIDDYPHPSIAVTKFNFAFTYAPVPTSGDFRLDADAAAVEEVRSSYEAAFNDRLTEAMREPFRRVKDMLTYMVEKLEPAEEGKVKRYHDSLVDNATELLDLLAGFNISGDPELTRIENQLRSALTGVDINDIRKDEFVRADVQGQLKEILDMYEF